MTSYVCNIHKMNYESFVKFRPLQKFSLVFSLFKIL
nr:MAG TPA: hypothetical protein [Caudoviricetes sp.]